MKLFVGLGNPGSEHARQRHNVGFMAVDRIAERHGLGPWRKRFHGLVCDGPVNGKRVTLLKPQTYMNDSGRSVGEAQRYLKIAESDIYVFHDELDLAPAKLRIKTGGGNAGHNGLRSITAHVGNEYARVRIGIGHPGSKDAVIHYVLRDFAKVESTWLEPLLDAIADAAPRLAAGDDARFMTDVARSLRSEEGKGKESPAGVDEPVAGKPSKSPDAGAPRGHPTGERQSKRMSALAENLKRWLKGRGQES